MKTTKRILVVLLVLALFALPVAAEEQRVDTLFTKRMPRYTITKTGRTDTLKARAQLPKGVNAELKYQWYETDWEPMVEVFAYEDAVYSIMTGATDPQLIVSVFAEELNGAPIVSKFYRLQAYYTEGSGRVIVDNDYTRLVCRCTLNDSYPFVFETFHVNVKDSWVPEFLYKVAFFPLALLLQYTLWGISGVSKLYNLF